MASIHILGGTHHHKPFTNLPFLRAPPPILFPCLIIHHFPTIVIQTPISKLAMKDNEKQWKGGIFLPTVNLNSK